METIYCCFKRPSVAIMHLVFLLYLQYGSITYYYATLARYLYVCTLDCSIDSMRTKSSILICLTLSIESKSDLSSIHHRWITITPDNLQLKSSFLIRFYCTIVSQQNTKYFTFILKMLVQWISCGHNASVTSLTWLISPVWSIDVCNVLSNRRYTAGLTPLGLNETFVTSRPPNENKKSRTYRTSNIPYTYSHQSRPPLLGHTLGCRLRKSSRRWWRASPCLWLAEREPHDISHLLGYLCLAHLLGFQPIRDQDLPSATFLHTSSISQSGAMVVQ